MINTLSDTRTSCRSLGRHRTLRSNGASSSTDKLSTGRALAREDPGIRVSREERRETESLTGQADWFGGSEEEDAKSRAAQWGLKRTGSTQEKSG